MQNLDKIMIDKLIETAIEQLKFSYTPYSNFKVGAALLAKNGEIYTGCNIENAAYTPTNCAERTVFFKAVSEGIKEFDLNGNGCLEYEEFEKLVEFLVIEKGYPLK